MVWDTGCVYIQAWRPASVLSFPLPSLVIRFPAFHSLFFLVFLSQMFSLPPPQVGFSPTLNPITDLLLPASIIMRFFGPLVLLGGLLSSADAQVAGTAFGMAARATGGGDATPATPADIAE
jgi:hypothetical protein